MTVYKKKCELSNRTKLEEELFYPYLFEFKPIKYQISVKNKYDYNWDLLLQMIAASFSSKYYFEFLKFENYDNENIEPEFFVKIPWLEINKYRKISELRSFHIEHLFEYFCLEHINISHKEMCLNASVLKEKNDRFIFYEKQRNKTIETTKRWDLLNVLY